MPFYEYECSACKFYVEALQKISDAPLRKCPSCKKQTLTRLVSAPVFRLKGGGWYETDFKSDNETKRNIAGREEGESKPAEAKADTTKDTPASTDKKPAEAKPAEVKTRPAPKKALPKPAAKKSKPAAKKKSGRR